MHSPYWTWEMWRQGARRQMSMLDMDKSLPTARKAQARFLCPTWETKCHATWQTEFTCWTWDNLRFEKSRMSQECSKMISKRSPKHKGGLKSKKVKTRNRKPTSKNQKAKQKQSRKQKAKAEVSSQQKATGKANDKNQKT